MSNIRRLAKNFLLQDGIDAIAVKTKPHSCMLEKQIPPAREYEKLIKKWRVGKSARSANEIISIIWLMDETEKSEWVKLAKKIFRKSVKSIPEQFRGHWIAVAIILSASG